MTKTKTTSKNQEFGKKINENDAVVDKLKNIDKNLE